MSEKRYLVVGVAWLALSSLLKYGADISWWRAVLIVPVVYLFGCFIAGIMFADTDPYAQHTITPPPP
jgi:hypothetical protein